jgi:hypothetical protein
LRPGPRAVSLPMFMETVSIPPHSSLEVSTRTHRPAPGGSLVAWWQPPVAGGWKKKSPPVVAMRSKLSGVFHDPFARIALSPTSPPGWRERVADWIGPRPRLVSSEPFVLEP